MPSDSTLMLPLLAATSYAHMFKPKPIPSGLRSADCSSFPNCLNKFFLSSSVIPTPVSLTLTRSLDSALSQYAVRIMLPAFVNLRLFFVRLISIYFNLTSSPIKVGSLMFPCSYSKLLKSILNQVRCNQNNFTF